MVADDEKCAQEAHSRLARIGLKGVIGYSLADETQWRREGIDLASLSVQRCEDVRRVMHYNSSLQLVDVRSRAEWLKGHLPGAISVPLLDLDRKEQIIDASKPSLVYCHEGYRATTAASILTRKGGGNISILIDGVEGWLASGLPLEVPDGDSLIDLPHPQLSNFAFKVRIEAVWSLFSDTESLLDTFLEIAEPGSSIDQVLTPSAHFPVEGEMRWQLEPIHTMQPIQNRQH